jgi:nucleotide-binding universal stress UspA family protein
VWVVLVVIAWLATGAVPVAIMHRRGHDTFAWAWLFLVLGPLALPLAISADRHRPPQPAAPSHDGALDALVVHDGSTEAEAALQATLILLGQHLTSLTLAAVLDFEATTTVRGQEAEREEQQRLHALARTVGLRAKAPIDTVVLFGEAHALQHFAGQHGYELIVAGSRMARRMHLGSRPARDRATETSIPVLIGPRSR